MGINVYRREAVRVSNTPKILFLGLLFLSLVVSLVLSQKKQVTIVIDNERTAVVTFMSKTENILKNNNIVLGEKDHLSVSLNSTLKDGDIIFLKRAVDVNLVMEGTFMKVPTSKATVEGFLKEEGISLGEADKISVPLNAKIVAGMDLKITRVTKYKQLEKRDIPYPVIEKKNNRMKEGDRKIISPGKVGEKHVEVEVTMEDFDIADQKDVSVEVIREPIEEVVEVGTLKELVILDGKKTVYYSSIVPVLATAYTGDFNPQGVRDDPYAGKTAVGTWAKRDPDGISTVAVDPKVIPLGTKVYVEGYGLAIAEDVGGAIKGNRIDCFYYTYPETIQWGVRNVKVYILEDVQQD